MEFMWMDEGGTLAIKRGLTTSTHPLALIMYVFGTPVGHGEKFKWLKHRHFFMVVGF
jgi:hypothetical protein